ncbi:uncharacterized protein [Coffea arabica]|uniref:Endonuclease/exonuclease/phosphatase domain-containing protein n=1 Tax=Coffea arabica TaxID=13443 RepID=A0ABM4UFL4_COFAR
MERARSRLRFDHSVAVDSMHRSGGMALFWKQEVNVIAVNKTVFTIEAHIVDRSKQIEWWLVGIYASCDAAVRKNQWQVLNARKWPWGQKWIVAGDFNDIVSNDEKWRGRRRDEWSFRDFKQFIDDNEPVDVGFDGNPWTWCNNWENEGEIKQRLDRMLCTFTWFQSFDNTRCKHIDNYSYDHSMLVVDTEPEENKRRKKFIFDKRWIEREGIDRVIKEAWGVDVEGSKMYKVTRKISNCRVALLKWEKNFQNNSRKVIDRIKADMERLKHSPDFTKGGMDELKRQLKQAYSNEEMYWSQKSRVTWLKEGDKNT